MYLHVQLSDVSPSVKNAGGIVSLNSVCREILSSFTIDSYDKVRGWNKAQ